METVANGEALYGVVPIENTSTGSIADIYDLMVDHDVTIVAEHVIKVDQALLGLPGASIDDLKVVYSHQQGLLQCTDFLEEHPAIRGVEYDSTAGAAKKIAEENHCYKMMLLTGSKEERTLNFYRNAGYNSSDKTAFIQWIDM